ncbi:alkaline phosphatase family protein [Halorientalis brevis]|uniref:Alkaline phosphatase family protein n=1 Tax=Halorientalis brevis TaxID=1126241 RepID=A0ABD6C8T8_9EURY|nr:alkaline phosphatase family protein [Halorientalis brevis]
MLIVMGLDSLDADTLQRYTTPSIDTISEEGEGGRMETPDGLNRDELNTQLLWPSMLAGQNPRDLFPSYYEDNSQSTKHWNTKVLSNPLVRRIEREVSNIASSKAKRYLKSLLAQFGYEKEHVGENRLAEAGSLLDSAAAPHLISVPGISEDDMNRDLKGMIAPKSARSEGRSGYEPAGDISLFEQKALSADANRLIRFLNAIASRRHDFVMCHFFSLDLVQHVWADTPPKLQRWYGLYDDFVRRVRQTLSEDDTLVLVSDHGMEKEGIHSKRAFYASNRRLWKDTPRKMEDLREVLESELPRHSPADGEQMDDSAQITNDTKEHLSKLGYFS